MRQFNGELTATYRKKSLFELFHINLKIRLFGAGFYSNFPQTRQAKIQFIIKFKVSLIFLV